MIPLVLDPTAKTQWVGLAVLASALALVAVAGFRPRPAESADSRDETRSSQAATDAVAPGTGGRGSTQPPRTEIETGHEFLALQEEWESRLTDKVNAALREAFDDHVAVTIHVELEPRSEFKTGVHVPEGGLPPNLLETVDGRSDARQSGSSRGDPGATEVTSADPRLAPAVRKTGSKLREDAGYRRDTVRRQSIDPALYGHKTERLLAPVIRRITASVIIDERVLELLVDAASAKSSVLEIVKNAIGYDELRGDRINEPVIVKFAASSAAAPEASGGLMPAIGAATGGLVMTILVLVWLGMRRRAIPKKSEDSKAEAEVEQELSPEELAERMRVEIEKAVRADPRAVSQLLDDWLMERSP